MPTSSQEELEAILAQELEEAHALPDAQERAFALVKIAFWQAEYGDKKHCPAILNDARRAAIRMPPGLTKDRVFMRIAEVLAQIGDVDAACALTWAIGKDTIHVHTLVSIIQRQAQDGDVPGAIRTAYAQPGTEIRAKMLAEIAVWLARTRDIAGARHLERTLTDPVLKAHVLHEIGEAHLRSSDESACRETIAEAIRIAQTISDAAERCNALAEIASTQATVGDVEECRAILAEALQTADTITDPEAHASVQMRVAEGMAKAGDVPDALSLARNIPLPMWRVMALQRIANVQRWARDYEGHQNTLIEAKQIADTISQDEEE